MYLQINCCPFFIMQAIFSMHLYWHFTNHILQSRYELELFTDWQHSILILSSPLSNRGLWIRFFFHSENITGLPWLKTPGCTFYNMVIFYADPKIVKHAPLHAIWYLEQHSFLKANKKLQDIWLGIPILTALESEVWIAY